MAEIAMNRLPRLKQVLVFSLFVLIVYPSIGNLNATSERCISYDSGTKTITVSCKSSNLEQVYDALKATYALGGGSDGVWLLNSNLKILPESTFYINSTDTKWLKINSTMPSDVYRIFVLGSLRIDSVKISSWNTSSNSHATTDGTLPRASITVLPEGTGKTDITNSEIAYLGDGNISRGQGLSYWSGDGSVLKNNTMHHMYYAFYSERIGNITIENNHIYGGLKYGIDPHTGTHDMTIRNNKVHDNGHIGIICSIDCKNITIEGNNVFNNTDAGVMLSKNVKNSVVRNNTIQDENTAVSVSDSSYNEVYFNNISETNNGIQVKANSSSNRIHNNSISVSARCGIEVSHNAYNNSLVSNTILKSKNGVCLIDNPYRNTLSNNTIDAASGLAVQVKDSNSADNIFKYNQLVNVSHTPIKLTNGTLKIINNTVN